MSAEEDDKPFEPTEQKLRKARQEGDVPRSLELNGALMYLGLWLSLAFATGWAVPRWIAMASRTLGAEPWRDTAGRSIFDLAHGLAGFAALAVMGFVTVMALPVLVGLIVQRAILFTPKKLAPDLNRLNVLKNAKQKFGSSGLVTFAISLAKACLVGLGGWLLYSSLLGWLMSAEAMSDLQWVDGMDQILRQAVLLALAISVVFAGVDLLWKRFEYLRRQRMSRKEMQDEFKESEGDPHLKGARRRKAMEIVLNSMLADVEMADVVIVNPTHYAVALEWKRGSGRAPVCLAKGVDEIARKIRERAQEHHVPIWSDPPCARALHAALELGEEIRHEHFAAVAMAIRFAETIRKKRRSGWAVGPATTRGDA